MMLPVESIQASVDEEISRKGFCPSVPLDVARSFRGTAFAGALRLALLHFENRAWSSLDGEL